jgi:hypothetical protein
MVQSRERLLRFGPIAVLSAFILASFLPTAPEAEGARGGGISGNVGIGSGKGGQVIVEEGGGSPPPPPPCTVSVGMTSAPLTYRGLPRNNPDGTYYPGDAFSVSLAISSQHCSSVDTSVSGDSGVSIACTNCANTRVDVSPFASPGPHSVRLSVSGTGPGGSGFASTSLSIHVANPMITVRVVPANVTDADGYLMRNADDTHYVNDAVALKYEVDYRFKDARRGVIEPEVTRIHPYPRIADLDCLEESCTLVVPATSATSEYRANFDYATGLSVANATAPQGLGQKEFRFDVRLKNAGVYTGMGTTYTHTVSIIEYKPVFAIAHPYLNLKEGGDRSYEKELTIGLHYLGSSDSDGTVKPLRRAKLNLHTNQVSALVPGTNATDITGLADLKWLSTSAFQTESSPEVTTVSENKPGKHAMIERAGYAKIAMEMAGYDPVTFTQIQNVTASPVFYSKDFAGKGMAKLFDVAYTYPDTYFANTITAKVLDGDSVAARTVRMEVRPATGSTVTVCEYYEKHALYSTGDPVFSKMVLSDVYPCYATSQETGTGTVEVRANMTGILIPKIYDALYPGGLAALPPEVALGSPSSIQLQISVSGTGKVRTHDLILYAHDRDAEIIANIGQNNILDVARYGSTVTVKSPANFGAITSLQVNDMIIPDACFDRCTLHFSGAATIVATNSWGGKATAVFAAPAKADSSIARAPSVLAENGGQNVIFAVFGAAGAAVAGVIFRKYVSWLGDVFY